MCALYIYSKGNIKAYYCYSQEIIGGSFEMGKVFLCRLNNKNKKQICRRRRRGSITQSREIHLFCTFSAFFFFLFQNGIEAI